MASDQDAIRLTASDHDAGVPVQYLHPVSLMFALARSVRVFAVPALLVMFSVDRPGAGDADFLGLRFENWQYWLLLPLLPSALDGISTSMPECCRPPMDRSPSTS